MPGEKYFRSAVMGYMKEDVLAYIEQQNNALSEMRQALDASLKAAAKAENDKLKEIEGLRNKIEFVTEELNQEKLSNTQLDGELSEIRLHEQTLEGQLVVAENIASQKDVEMEELRHSHEAGLAELRRSYEERLTQLQQKISELELLHQQQADAIRQEYEARINSLTDEIVSVRSDLSRARGQLDEVSQQQAGTSDALERLGELSGKLGEGSSQLLGASDMAAGAVEQLADALAALTEALRDVRENADAIRSIPL